MTPASAWADFVRTMSPDDVLYIDGYLMDHPANREAAEAALRALPEGVRVILTAARPLDPGSEQAEGLRRVGIEVPEA